MQLQDTIHNGSMCTLVLQTTFLQLYRCVGSGSTKSRLEGSRQNADSYPGMPCCAAYRHTVHASICVAWYVLACVAVKAVWGIGYQQEQVPLPATSLLIIFCALSSNSELLLCISVKRNALQLAKTSLPPWLAADTVSFEEGAVLLLPKTGICTWPLQTHESKVLYTHTYSQQASCQI